jgi:hypothetical protein
LFSAGDRGVAGRDCVAHQGHAGAQAEMLVRRYGAVISRQWFGEGLLIEDEVIHLIDRRYASRTARRDALQYIHV